MKLTAYFKDNNMYNLTTEDQLIKPKQKLIKSGDQIKATIPKKRTQKEAKMLQKTEEQNSNKTKYYNNLTAGERKALKELADRNNRIIDIMI